MTTKKTYNELMDFDFIANVYLQKLDGKESKLTYAILKVQMKLKRLREKISEKINKISIKHCLVDDSKKEKPIMKDQHKDLCFSKEGQDLANDEISSTITGETKYEIEPYYCTSVPEDLKQHEIEIFSGLVIDPAVANKMLGIAQEKEEKVEAEAIQ